MAEVQARLQSLSEEYQKQQNELQSSIASRQKFEGQRQENIGVQKEFDRAEDETIYKLVGPILVKQDKFDAENTVKGRLEFIGAEIVRLDSQIKDTEGKMDKMRSELVQLQASAQGSAEASAK